MTQIGSHGSNTAHNIKDNVGDLRQAYEIWHQDKSVDEYPDAPWYTMIRKHLTKENVNQQCVLEVGCGRGDLACFLACHFGRPSLYVAADISRVAVQKGKAFAGVRDLPSIKWAVSDIEELPYADDAFDTVISCETIEHIPNPRRGLDELRRVLKPGGSLFLTTPNYLGTLGLYRGYLRLIGRRYTEVGQPLNQFVVLPRTVAWIRATGLDIVTVDAIGHYLPFPGRPPIEFPSLNKPRLLMRWFGLHSFVQARKPLPNT